MTDESLSFRLLAILFPIFGIVAAGYFYARHHKPEMAVANRLNMDIFVPALVFAAMAGKSFDLLAYGPLALDPAAAVLHYGQEIFEGIKAYRHADGSIWTFRPQANGERLQRSAARLILPSLPVDEFV